MPAQSLHVRYRIALSASTAKRPAYRVLPPVPLHGTIVLAALPTGVGGLRLRIALEKESEAAVAPGVARNGDIDHRRLAGDEHALGLVLPHRDKIGVVV